MTEFQFKILKDAIIFFGGLVQEQQKNYAGRCTLRLFFFLFH